MHLKAPELSSANIDGMSTAAVAVKTSNLQDLARQVTTVASQGVRPVSVYRPRAAAPHLLPNGLSTARAAKATGPLWSLGSATPSASALTVQAGVAGGPQPNTAIAPPPVTGFAALSTVDNKVAYGTEFEPPDQGLAVNAGKILEASNLMIQLYDAASHNPDIVFDGGQFASPVPLPLFFQDPGVFSDPQVFFDPSLSASTDLTAAAKGRWVVTVLSYADSFSFDSGTNQYVPVNPNNQYIDVAVSQTSDARGNWNIYRVRTTTDDLQACADPTSLAPQDCLPDYPKMGYDANGFFISVNLFNNVDYNFVGAATFALPKAKMRDGAAINYARFFYVDPVTSSPSFLVHPSSPAPGQAYSTAAGGTEFLLEARKLIDGVSNTIRLWAIENTSALIADGPCTTPTTGVCAMSAHFKDVATPSTPGTVAVPTPGYYAGDVFYALQPNYPGPQAISNSSAAPAIDPGYPGFSASVRYANGRVFGALATANAYNPSAPVAGTLPGNLLSWYAISPTVSSTGAVGASLAAKGTVVPPAGYFLQYPAFGLLKSGAGVLAFSLTNPSLNVPGNFPSTGYVKFTGTGISGNLVVTGQGVAADDGFTAFPPYSSGVGRWGDYSAAVVDPTTVTSTPTYYTGGEIVAAPYTQMGYRANWSTYISVVH